METQCPNCKQLYDIDDEALGQIIECPECKTEFTIKPASSGKKDIKKNNYAHKQTVPKKAIAIISLIFVVIIGGIAGYLFLPTQPSQSRAIDNRSKVYYWIIQTKFKVNNENAIKTLCKERSKLELKEAEKQKIDDSYVAFWCDKDVLSFFSTIINNLNSNNRSLDDKRAEFEQQAKKLQEILDTKHPQNEQIVGLTDIIEKEYSPIEQIALKHNYARSLFLIEQDKQYSEIDSDKMFNDAEKRLNILLYNLYSKDNEIDYPNELRALCINRAKDMISIISDDKALAIDWAKIILSDEMKNELESSLKQSGTTRSALYWLKDFGEKQIPPIPFGCRMDYYLEINDTWSFWKQYYDVSHYGKEISK